MHRRSISIPLPTNRLALSALRALQVDAELSPLVQRSFSLAVPEPSTESQKVEGLDEVADMQAENRNALAGVRDATEEEKTVLRTVYAATTNRMLRVAVNGFMESIGVVLGVMEELDVDVLAESVQTEQS